MTISNQIMEEVVSLKPFEKAQLVDRLITMLDKPDAELDKFWAQEAESRLSAYKMGKLKSISIEEVLAKYK